jgi:hypothetical protein
MSRANVTALLLTVLIVGAVVVYGPPRPFAGGRGGVRFDERTPGGGRTFTFSAPLAGVTILDAEIRMEEGVLHVRTIDSGNAYEAQIIRAAGRPVDVNYREGRLRITDRGRRFLGAGGRNEWTIGLTGRVPLDLEVHAGAGRATLDLTGMSGRAQIQAGAGASRIEARSGIGEFVLDFSSAAQGTGELEVHAGVGRVLLLVPGNLGVRVRAGGGLKHLRLQGFTQQGDEEYVNAVWGTAPARLDVRASLGVGEFVVQVK